MKQSILVLAMMGGAMSLAHAQSTITTYGVMDAGVVQDRGCADCTTQVSSGIASGSRVGVRGSEFLGNNTSAVFALEAGVEADTGRAEQNRVFGRQAYVGLRNEAGSVTLGRQYNLQYLAITDVADPFHGGMAGSATNLIGYSGKQVDNSVQVYSAEVEGVSAGASYGFADENNAALPDRSWGVSVGVEYGALTLRGAHQNRHVAKIQMVNQTGTNFDAKNSIIAANYRLSWGTAYAAYSVSRGWGNSPLFNPDNPYGASMAGTASTNSRDMLVGVAVPLTRATTFLASYVRKNDRDLANRDARQMAVGASYAMSRRTDFYAAYSHIANTNGADYTVGSATSKGAGNAALNVGMRHAF